MAAKTTPTVQDRLGMNDNIKKFPLEQNESGDFLPGHANEDIDEIGQSDQLAKTKCEKHGHLWDPRTGNCNEEGCEANYYKEQHTPIVPPGPNVLNKAFEGEEYEPGWKDPRKMTPEELAKDYYDNKMKHRYEMLPLLATLFLIGIVMVVIAYFFNL